MGGLLAKTYANYRQRRYRRWKLQVCFTKFGTITINVLRNGGLFDLGKVLNPSEAIKYWIELDFQADLVTVEK